MNVVAFIVLLSFSVKTVFGIKRIPIKPNYRADSDANYDREGSTETYDYNPQIEREIEELDLNETQNVTISTTTSTKPIAEFKFTDFILETAKVLKTYDDKVLEQAFEIIDNEVWNDVYKGCKSHELADVRKYASDQLGLLKDAPADKLRQHLNYIINILTEEDYGDIRDLVVYINSLYAGEGNKFIEVLLALVHKRISDDVDLGTILKDALNDLIFDHYCKLDDLVRHELMKMIKHYWLQFISQVVNDKGGTNKDILPYVTPFVYDKLNKDPSRQRRFNKVKSGRPLLKRWKDKSKYEEHISNRRDRIKLRSNNVENTGGNLKSVVWDGGEDATPDTKLVQRNKTEGKTENTLIKTSETSTEQLRFTRMLTPKLNIMSSTIKNDLHYRNNTILRLINIGTLAKEINDMLRSKGKVRREGEHIMNWDSLMGMDYLGYMMDNLRPVTQKINTDDGHAKKEVIISMKANYRE